MSNFLAGSVAKKIFFENIENHFLDSQRHSAHNDCPLHDHGGELLLCEGALLAR